MTSNASLRTNANLDELAGIRSFVEDNAYANQADAQEVAELVQAVDEAATNVIRHGYRGHAGMLEIEIERRNDALVIRMRDRAPVFDPTLAPEPDLAMPLEKRPLGGMGIYLIRRCVDSMTHRSLAGGGNELVLVKKLKALSKGE